MANPTENLYSASFRGVPFFVTAETRDGGRKLKIYEHPLSDNRTIQDLGRKQPVYSLQAIVIGTNYLADARRLRIACERKLAGTLSVPSFGIFQAQCTSMSESVSDVSHGVITFDLTFAVVRTQTTKSFGTPTTIPHATAKAMESLTDEFKGSYVKPVTANNRDVLKNDIEQMAKDFTDNIPNTKTLTDGLLNGLNDIIDDVDKFTRQLMREGVLGTIMNNLPDDGSLFGNVKELWTFGNNLTKVLPLLLEDLSIRTTLGTKTLLLGPYHIPTWLKNTKNRKVRTENRVLLVGTVRSFGMVCALEQAAYGNYTTVDEIQDRIDEIEDGFTNIVYDTTLSLPSSIVSTLEELKTVCYRELDKKRQRAYKIKEVDIKGDTTTPLLAYQLYYEEIVNSNSIGTFNTLNRFLGNINPKQRRDRLSGTISVLGVQRG